MNFGTFNENPYYVKYETLLKQLHQLIADDLGESEDASMLRNQMDDLADGLASEEVKRLQGLSGDLFTLYGEEFYEQDEQAEWNKARIAQELKGAWKRDDRQAILSLLRKGPVLPEAQTSFIRARSYAELGHLDTALLFMDHSAQLDPENDSYKMLALEARKTLGRIDEASRLSEQYLEDPNCSISLRIEAASVLFHAAKGMTEQEALEVYERIVRVLEDELGDYLNKPATGTTKFMLPVGFIIVGLCLESLNRISDAIHVYDKALQREPTNDLVLSARGLVLSKDQPERARRDFELAVEQNTTVIWPYLFLARHALAHGQLEDCLKFGDKVMELTNDSIIIAEVCQWAAIAGYHLGFPFEAVEMAFRNALALDPLNETIQRNYQKFLVLRTTGEPRQSVQWEEEQPDITNFARARADLAGRLTPPPSVLAGAAS